jgi:multiple sugar transport system substrate-binding protein
MNSKKIFILLSCLTLLVTLNFHPALAKEQITFWTTEDEKDRVDIQKALAKTFEQKTGIQVQVIPVKENLLTQRITAAYAANSLPDVVFHPIDHTIGWFEEKILDAKSATDLIKELGEKTFGQGPLNLIKVKNGYAAVPMDGWGQLLLFRKDLFEKEKLAVPDTWDHILKAAVKLHNPPLLWGFEAATDPGQVYTQQVFEHIALSNNVRLCDKKGNIRLNTPEMIETLQFYKKLASFTPPGNLYWLHTRMDYLSGRAAMIIWSPFILDELSGLRKDQPVIPDIAQGKPGYLAQNTGFVSVIRGPKGAAQYGQINYLGITRDADKEKAKKWVAYLLNEGYPKWLSMAAEGKLPVRKGDQDDPNRFIKQWMELEFGVTTKAKISQFYGMDTVKTIINGVDGFDRWGFAGGKGALISKIYGTKAIPEILKKVLVGELTPQQGAETMDKRVKALASGQ